MTGTRNSLVHLVNRAVRRPRLILPYVKRRLRNRRIRGRTGDHVAFYREVMASDVGAKGATGAVGTPSRERWLAIGEVQYEFLTTHGLQPQHRLLEIGCGNLRAGWRFIEYLEAGRYVGVDASPDIVLAALQTIVEYELQDKLPVVTLVDGTSLDFLPEAHFDVIHAHSVFTHTPIEIVEAYLRSTFPILKPGGFFDFTYNRNEDGVWDFLQEDFYYPLDVLVNMAEQAGFEAQPLTDWTYKQPKIRAVKPRGERAGG